MTERQLFFAEREVESFLLSVRAEVERSEAEQRQSLVILSSGCSELSLCTFNAFLIPHSDSLTNT
jgi:hypothetical protein